MTARALSLVFTGHMVDLPDRSSPRFPPELVEAAGREIERRVTRQVEGRDKSEIEGFSSLARGGDILFHEICRARGIATTIVLPFAPDRFLKTSVEGAEGDDDWPRRFQKLWDETPPSRRHDLGVPQSDEAYALCNARILDLARRAGEIQLIALWDGGGGGGPGGTEHFLGRVEQNSSLKPDIIDPRNLSAPGRGG